MEDGQRGQLICLNVKLILCVRVSRTRDTQEATERKIYQFHGRILIEVKRFEKINLTRRRNGDLNATTKRSIGFACHNLLAIKSLHSFT